MYSSSRYHDGIRANIHSRGFFMRNCRKELLASCPPAMSHQRRCRRRRHFCRRRRFCRRRLFDFCRCISLGACR